MSKYINRPFEVKQVSEDGTFEGFGSVFGEVDSYEDVVVAGAFKNSLQQDFAAKNRFVPMLWQHKFDQPIGIYPTIQEEDTKGLFLKGSCNMDVQQGRECHALMKQGALTGLSIGYETISYEARKDSRGRTLKEVKLWEVSPVTFPAGDSARVVMVKRIEEVQKISQLEDVLRDAGMSSKEAVIFIAAARRMFAQSESALEQEQRAMARIKAAAKSIINGE